jgi:hypothetical protein
MVKAERMRRETQKRIPAPSTAAKDNWPPDYISVLAWRRTQIARFELNPQLIKDAKAYYRSRPVEFINHWCDTYDPRLAGTKQMAKMPLVLFERQDELVQFLLACVQGEGSGLVEKCRDMGATWVCGAFSVWLWLFWPGAAVGWGSRKEQLVDQLGNTDSIFEKIRIIIRGLPVGFLPSGFVLDQHMTFMRFVNPENGATITGEAGDNIGRGGRKLIYFKDESAHYERPEKIEAALADNTRVQIDISSVNGLGNVFHRRRESGVDWVPVAEVRQDTVNVFVMDWRDHPGKSKEWYEQRRTKAEGEGLLHIFAQEVDRNYSASVDGVIIPAEWVKAAIDAHIELGLDEEGPWGAALDVSDGGGDRNALANRQGVILRFVDEWAALDTGETARRAVGHCEAHGAMHVQYDCIGVGSGVKAETNRLVEDHLMPKELRFVPWNAGAEVQSPDARVIEGDKDSPLNKDFYANLKAQAWWELRLRFWRTYQAMMDEESTFDPDALISIDSRIPRIRQVEKELSQATASKGSRLKLVVDKSPEGTRSPNLADAIVMAFWPMRVREPAKPRSPRTNNLPRRNSGTSWMG